MVDWHSACSLAIFSSAIFFSSCLIFLALALSESRVLIGGVVSAQDVIMIGSVFEV